MKIIKLQAENVKRLKAVEIEPDGSMVVISGRNAQGKTSVLDSIMLALANARKMPLKPIRNGESKARVKLDLGDMTVERTITDKDTYLKITNKEGFQVSSPQAMLDKLVGALSFDPLEFTKMEQDRQVKILKDITGLDLTIMDKEKKDYYEQRTILNRELKSIVDRIDRAGLIDPDIPEEEVKASDLTAEYQEATRQIGRNQELKAKLTYKRNDIKVLDDRIAKINEQIETLQQELDECQTRRENVMVEGKALKQAVDALKDPDLDAITAKIGDVEALNARIRQKKDRRALDQAKGNVEAKISDLEGKMAEIDHEKDVRIRAAKMPITDLEFGDQGVAYKGIPFAQLSSSEQLKVSMAISIAANPQVKVILIRDGSLLDTENMKVIKAMADKHDYQVWMEKVDESGQVGIVIEDGMVQGVK